MRKFKMWPENTVDARGRLIQATPIDVEADDWRLAENGALIFVRGDRNWMIVAHGSWSALQEQA